MSRRRRRGQRKKASTFTPVLVETEPLAEDPVAQEDIARAAIEEYEAEVVKLFARGAIALTGVPGGRVPDRAVLEWLRDLGEQDNRIIAATIEAEREEQRHKGQTPASIKPSFGPGPVGPSAERKLIAGFIQALRNRAKLLHDPDAQRLNRGQIAFFLQWLDKPDRILARVAAMGDKMLATKPGSEPGQ